MVTTLAYLLPVMIGWLHVGSEPEKGHLRDSLKEASRVVWVATDDGDEPVLAGGLTHPRRAIESMKWADVDLARKDELKTNPIFNYSRVFVWSQIAFAVYTLTSNAAAEGEREPQINPSSPTMGDLRANMGTNGQHWTTREVIRSCVGERATILLPLTIPNGPPLPSIADRAKIREPCFWAPGTWKRVALAASLALGLQWGTTGAGIFIYYKMQPVGLGCRTTSLLAYGVLGTISFLLLIASSILAHLSRPRNFSRHQYTWLRFCQEAGAIFCRWLGKTLTMAAGLWILIISHPAPRDF